MNDDIPRSYNVDVSDRGNGHYGVTVSPDNTGSAVGVMLVAVLGAFALPIVLPLYVLWSTRRFTYFLLAIPAGFLGLGGLIYLSSKWNWLGLPDHLDASTDWFMFYLQIGADAIGFAFAMAIVYLIYAALRGIWRFFSSF